MVSFTSMGYIFCIQFDPVNYRPMFNHGSLGFSGRTGGINNVGQISRIVKGIGVWTLAPGKALPDLRSIYFSMEFRPFGRLLWVSSAGAPLSSSIYWILSSG